MMQAIFFKGTRKGSAGEIDRMIRALTNGPYSHSALLFSDGKIGEATNVDEAGVRIRVAKLPLNTDGWDIVDLPEFNERHARDWFIAHLGEPYDYDGALRMSDPTLHQDPGAWYCSEAVMAALGITDSKPSQSTSNTLYAYLTAT